MASSQVTSTMQHKRTLHRWGANATTRVARNHRASGEEACKTCRHKRDRGQSLLKKYRHLLLTPHEDNVEMRGDANSIRLAESPDASCNGNGVKGCTRAARVTTCQTRQISSHRSRHQGGWHVLASGPGRLHSSERRGRSRHSNQTPGCRPSSPGLQASASRRLCRGFGK